MFSGLFLQKIYHASLSGRKGTFPLRSLQTMDMIQKCCKKTWGGSWSQNRFKTSVPLDIWKSEFTHTPDVAQAPRCWRDTLPSSLDFPDLPVSPYLSPSPLFSWLHWMMPEELRWRNQRVLSLKPRLNDAFYYNDRKRVTLLFGLICENCVCRYVKEKLPQGLWQMVLVCV